MWNNGKLCLVVLSQSLNGGSSLCSGVLMFSVLFLLPLVSPGSVRSDQCDTVPVEPQALFTPFPLVSSPPVG